MEDTNQPIDFGVGGTPIDQGLRFTDEARADLLETSKWAMFYAVLLFLILGIVIIAALFFMMAGSRGFSIGLVFILFYGTILFFPGWYFYKFATLTRRAIEMDDTEALDEGFTYLSRFYRFVGIVVIVFISLYLLVLVFGIATATQLRGF